MNVYKVINNCSISYTTDGEENGFALYPGDLFFIELDSCWVKEKIASGGSSMYLYKRRNKLVKIYYNKLLPGLVDNTTKWTWVDNINLIDPKINRLDLYNDSRFYKDITIQYNRNNNINKILNDKQELI
jgi:hypothetical protein